MRVSRRQVRHAPAHARRSGSHQAASTPASNRVAAESGSATAGVLIADSRSDGGRHVLIVDEAAIRTETVPPHEQLPPQHDHPPTRHDDAMATLRSIAIPVEDPRGRQREDARPRSGRALVREVKKRARTLTVGGAELRLLVLACTAEDTVAVDLASGAVLRLRIPWPDGHEPDLSPFDVVEARLADDPERDDLAQPEASTVATLPRHVGTLRGRRARRILSRLATPPDGPLLGFLGPSAPYWEFRGFRPSVALIRPARGPQLIRRPADGTTWVRFGLERDDVWLPVEELRTCRAMAASRRERLTGKPLNSALGFTPHYLLVAVSAPRDGHCYKVCAAVLPKD